MSHAWMPIYWGDFLRDTTHLNAAEVGAYMLLIGHYWCHGSLPKDEESLSQICRMHSSSFASAFIKLRLFFDTEMRHKRIEKELEKSKNSYEKRANAARKRWNTNSLPPIEQSLSNGHALDEQPQPHSTIANAIVKERKRASPKGPLSENYIPNATTLRIAKEEGLSEEALRRTTETMRAWAVANGVRRVDWNAQHQNWIRRETDRRGSTNVKPDKSAYGGAERLAERVRQSVEAAYAPVRPLLTVTGK